MSVRLRLVNMLETVVRFSSRRRHTRFDCDWSSDVCSSDLLRPSTRVLHLFDELGGGVFLRIADDGDPPPQRLDESAFRYALDRVVRSLAVDVGTDGARSEEHTSELQSQSNLVCRLLLEKKKKHITKYITVPQSDH